MLLLVSLNGQILFLFGWTLIYRAQSSIIVLCENVPESELTQQPMVLILDGNQDHDHARNFSEKKKTDLWLLSV